jgi:DsbC/DsbD-like thiol-disulfide interchange protein
MRTLGLAIFLLVVLPAAAVAGRGDELVHVSVMGNVSAVKPGDSFMVGVMLKIDSGWHIYWKTPGDSGLPTKVTLDLPEGFSAGEVEYPVPTRQEQPGDVVNNIYEDQVMLLVPVSVGKDVAVGQNVTITAHVKWLVCQEECVPGAGVGSMGISTGDSAEPANEGVFAKWMGMIPKGDLGALAGGPTVKVNQKHVEVKFEWKSDVSEVQWFAGDVGEAMLKNVKLQTQGKGTTISFDVDGGGGSVPAKMDSVLAFVDSSGVRQGLELPLVIAAEGR